jgi:hypothetical protein
MFWTATEKSVLIIKLYAISLSYSKLYCKFNRKFPGIDVLTKTTIRGKAIPLQVLTGPEGSRRLRLPDFKTIGT